MKNASKRWLLRYSSSSCNIRFLVSCHPNHSSLAFVNHSFSWCRYGDCTSDSATMTHTQLQLRVWAAP